MKRRTSYGAIVSTFVLAALAACGGGSSGGGSSAVPATGGAPAAPGVVAAPGASAAPGAPGAPGASASPAAPGTTPTPAPTGVGVTPMPTASAGATPPPAIPVSAAAPTALRESITVGATMFPGVGPSDTAGAAGNAPIDGVTCDPTMSTTFHHHAHVSVFSGTAQYIVPMAIGMYQPQPDAAGDYTPAATCFYWLHVHDHSGILHLEAPSASNFTLKNLFDEWGQPLSRTQVGPLSGTVRVYVTDIDAATPPAEFTGDPNTIVLNQHLEISIFVNPVYGAGGNTIPTYTWTF